MFRVLRESSKVILTVAVIIVLYYYRVCSRMIQAVEGDHIDLLLHLIMLAFLFVGIFSYRGKRINKSQLSKCVLIWVAVISFGGLINWQDSSSFITPLLWCVYFLVAFSFYSSNSDEIVLKIASLVVCIITLIAGYFSMSIVSIINQTTGSSGDYDEFLNIVGFTVTTIPAVMTLKNQPLKWVIYFGIAIVSIVTARRMALVVVAMIVVLTVFDTIGKSKKRWIAIPALLIVMAFAFYYVTTTMSDSLELALGRLSGESLMSDDETGSARLLIWKDVFNASSQSNIIEWIFGHGSFGVYTVTHHTAAHNDFLEMFFDYGVIGLSLFIALHIFLIKRTILLFKRKSDYRFSYMMSYFILLLYGAFGNVLLYADYCLPLVMYWGYMEAGFMLPQKQRVKNFQNNFE